MNIFRIDFFKAFLNNLLKSKIILFLVNFWKNFILDFIAKIPPEISILIFIILGCAFFFPYSTTTHIFDLPKEGEIAKQTIIAPFTYDILKKPEEIEKERNEAISKVLLVLDYDVNILKATRKKINELRDLIMSSPISSADTINHHAADILNKELSANTIQILRKNPRLIDIASEYVVKFMEKGILANIIVPSAEKLSYLKNRYNVSSNNYIIYNKDFVNVKKGNIETTVQLSDIPIKEQALESIINIFKSSKYNNPVELNSVYEFLSAVIEPNVFVNENETAKRREKAALDVLPIKGKVIKETEIVRKHQIVTTDIVEKLFSLRKTQEKLQQNDYKYRIISANAGSFVLLAAIILFLTYYIKRYQWKSIRTYKNAMAIATVVVFQSAIIRLGQFLASRLLGTGSIENITMEYVIPTTVGSMLVSILIDVKVSIIVTLFTAIFFAMSYGFSLQFFILALLTGIFAGFYGSKIRYRWDFIKTIPQLFIIYSIIIMVFHTIHYNFLASAIFQNLGIAFINCVISIFIVMFSVIVFENLFDIATDMTLIELSDMNNPLLKKLSIEAAGTYNHSVLVGNLAESAAEKIGANPLRARVASYYHDIGKINKADYFIENAHDKSRHTKLAPTMSALIISSHVKEGVELAKEYRLPKVIQDAILQHHGTSTVSYFYEKARQQDPHNQIQEEHFRYPGPIPQTRENAIIMLADSVEAAARSLSSSSPKLLRDLVKKIIRDKFLSGQLDQSDLTLRDLDLIVDGFMPILQGIFHTREIKNNKETKA